MGKTTKANDKLKQGSYQYIMVGHRYYAGQKTEMIEITESKSVWAPLSKRPVRRRYFDFSTNVKDKRHARNARKDSIPTYMTPTPPVKETKRIQIPGLTSPVLTDDINQAKRFRHSEQVENACKMLESMYGKTGADVSVHKVEGDTK